MSSVLRWSRLLSCARPCLHMWSVDHPLDRLKPVLTWRLWMFSATGLCRAPSTSAMRLRLKFGRCSLAQASTDWLVSSLHMASTLWRLLSHSAGLGTCLQPLLGCYRPVRWCAPGLRPRLETSRSRSAATGMTSQRTLSASRCLELLSSCRSGPLRPQWLAV